LRWWLLLAAVAVAAAASAPLHAAGKSKHYPLEYRVALQPERDSARITLTLEKTALVGAIDFNLDSGLYSDFASDSPWRQEGDRVIWEPGGELARFSYTARISQQRPSKNSAEEPRYDALMTDDWAIFRGDDLVPPAKVTARPGARSAARLVFELPPAWSSVNTEWPEDAADVGDTPAFLVDNPERRFDRPTGWMIAGRLGTRRDFLGDPGVGITRVSVSAPRGSSLRRMDILTFLSVVWPEVQRTLGKLPEELLIVGGDDPLWLGGLSAANSLFLHADRPLVSENGTSALMHELTHMLTRITGKEGDDWIAEGIAEFYAIEFLARSGAMTVQRKERVLEHLRKWSCEVETLRKRRSTGPTTARAVLLFYDLDREIRSATGERAALDDVVRELMRRRKVGGEDLREAVGKVMSRPSRVLRSPLLQ
jgi:hypothetical protein